MSDGNRRRPTTRLALDVGPKARARLERISADAEKSLSEVVRDAVALYDSEIIRPTVERDWGKLIKKTEGET